jgi:hypothetical protein
LVTAKPKQTMAYFSTKYASKRYRLELFQRSD